MIEIIPLLLIFVILSTYMLGTFGVVHSGILNSIATRNYAFETMRNRASVVYFRDTPGSDQVHYLTMGYRLHQMVSEEFSPGRADIYEATERTMRVGYSNRIGGRDPATHLKIHNDNNITQGRRNTVVGVNPVWIKVSYGICVNAKCGE